MDTIYALSTGPSVAGIAVIRISGPEAMDVASLFGFVMPKPRQAALRQLCEPGSGEQLDEGLVIAFRAPHSFTGEDLVELHVHGSRAVVRSVVQVLSGRPGFRPADPGEFTRRAFLNGKMDLLDVEALGDVLQAETRAQARLAESNRHWLRERVASWRDTLVELRGLTEALIDFADEDDVLQTFDSNLQQSILDLTQSLSDAAAPAPAAEIIRDGYRVALLGAPNAGKSSLLNALARRDVAITSEIAGTTRDVLEVNLDLGGFAVVMMDTAGLRETDDQLEQEGISRTRRAADSADLRLWLQPLDAPAPEHELRDGSELLVMTKADLIDSSAKQIYGLVVSAKTGAGLDSLITELAERAREAAWIRQGEVALVHERQRRALLEASEALREAVGFGADALEMRAEGLRRASLALDRLVGRIEPDHVLDVVFKRFCIGK
ncbi:MAG: tRNA uridine-5-carboxymethylaminomethyl(34) synthesis GTPase MnmE [Beijerinckiaceae bacterium]|nr:tRNA uridine-5-carboxymethylaminomethyl(34) synthesis GTPase MnmE [Beijerinckiaceae bacterium]MCZ8300500.1 tRNA uridine-5-carboxymethylaminomethyl(34) synthesis GTPase MnmE [Beijerinckiaceae bacterium]